MGLREFLSVMRGMLNCLTVIFLFKFLLGLMKELYFDVKFYKYEYYIPDYETERREIERVK